jgi:hypothetical protein
VSGLAFVKVRAECVVMPSPTSDGLGWFRARLDQPLFQIVTEGGGAESRFLRTGTIPCKGQHRIP